MSTDADPGPAPGTSTAVTTAPTPQASGAQPDPAPPGGGSRRATRTARRAQARSAGGARWGLTLVGLVLLVAGVLTILLVSGVFGADRRLRPVLDPIAVQVLTAQPLVSRIVAVVAGLLLVLLGLLWAARALRPESRPDLVVDDGAGTEIRIDASAAADAVAGGALALPGVSRARARMVGSAARPAVRAVIWVDDDAEGSLADTVAEVCRRLDAEVLTQVRDSLGLADLPVAVRLELDSGRPDRGPRVA
ncbi:alkaline shock response membrane anchor protein AmaP [Pseudonocardia nantongensis]|uniref:alkaline shock response membrane anchor protein AmaP n=1 Tax=Pseudonocardia nantongensis TaxID=1181885 RepID=UPI003977E7DA